MAHRLCSALYRRMGGNRHSAAVDAGLRCGAHQEVKRELRPLDACRPEARADARLRQIRHRERRASGRQGRRCIGAHLGAACRGDEGCHHLLPQLAVCLILGGGEQPDYASAHEGDGGAKETARSRRRAFYGLPHAPDEGAGRGGGICWYDAPSPRDARVRLDARAREVHAYHGDGVRASGVAAPLVG